MSPIEIGRTAIANTFSSPLRTTLTILAIFVGAFTLILTNGVGTGINYYINTQVSSMGASDPMLVGKARGERGPLGTPDTGPAAYDPDRVMSARGMQIEALTERDIAAILAIDGIIRVEPLQSVYPDYVNRDGGTKYEFAVNRGGVGNDLDLLAGRRIGDDDAYTLLLPMSYLEPLGFASAEAAIGEMVSIGITDVGGEPHLLDAETVGVQQATILDLGAIVSPRILTALYEAQRTGMPAGIRDAYPAATTTMAPGSTAADEARIEAVLADAGYVGMTLQDQLGVVTAVINPIIGVLNAFAIISLIAAGFGIIDTLLMSVQERTREIGLMKSMGMSRGRLFALFSSEAIFIGFLGSAIGSVVAIALGAVISDVVASGPLADLAGLRIVSFDPTAVTTVIVLVMALAFLAGTLPAARAARLDPIEALGYE